MHLFSILHVEDDEADVIFMQEAFHRAGITNLLRVAKDGQEAVDYLEGKGEFANRVRFPLPKLVLLDLKLPNRSGFEVLRWIRAQPELKRMLVVVLSASPQRLDRDAAYELGANGYIVKPSRLSDLVEIVKSIRNYWLVSNQPPS